MLSVKLASDVALPRHKQPPTLLNLAVDIPLHQGIVGIMGHSGCGKTTLLRVIAGPENRYSGEVRLSDKVLWSDSDKINYKPEKRNIGLVFQDARLFSHLSVAGNLLFALKRARSALFTLDQVVQWFGLNKLINAPVGTLSGGEKQRVAVARAVLHSPDLLLLDEPFVALDLQNRLVLLNCLKQLYLDTRLPMIFVSHDISDIRQLCSYLLLMEQGKISHHGDTFHLLNQLETGLQLSQPIAATLACRFSEHQAQQPLIHLLLGEQSIFATPGEDGQWQPQRPQHCLIAATDVSISLNAISDCSIVNCLQARADKITWLDQQNVVITLALDPVLNEQVLYAQITGYSARRLALQAGMTVYALFKASAVTLL